MWLGINTSVVVVKNPRTIEGIYSTGVGRQVPARPKQRPEAFASGLFHDSVKLVNRLCCHAFGRICILFDLVKVQVLVDRSAVFVHDAHAFVVLGHCWNVAQLGGDSGQLG